jgi:SAGA-associated factor 29
MTLQWNELIKEFNNASKLDSIDLNFVARINKIHSKVSERQFTLKAAQKLSEIYKQAIEATTKHQQSIKNAIALLENLQPKRKDKTPTNSSPKRIKLQQLLPGTRVAANTGHEWILATVVNCTKNDVQVEDIEEEEDLPGTRKRYLLSLSKVIVINNTFIEFAPNHRVLALYPSSSCFYKATVVSLPDPSSVPCEYLLRFDDDGNIERRVDYRMVLDFKK